MAQAPIYSPGGPPKVAQLPGLDDAAAGFGLARDLGQLAGAVGADRQAERQTNVEIEKLQREGLELRETTSANAQLAQHQNDTDVFAAQQKLEHAGTGGAGVTEAVSKYWDDGVAKIMGGITSPLVQQRMIPQVASASRVKAEAQAWEIGARNARAITDAKYTANTVNNRAAARAPEDVDFKAFDEALNQNARMLQSLGMSEDQTIAAARESASDLAVAYNTNTARTDPAAALKQLDNERFTWLPEKIVTALRDNAEAEQHRQDSQAKAAAAADKSRAINALDTAVAELDTGAGKPHDYAAAADQYEALGETEKAVKARAKGQERGATENARGATLGELDQEISGLRAKQTGSAGGLSVAEATRMNGLIDRRTQKAAMLAKPGGALQEYMFATNQQLAPIDWNNPASLQARTAVAIEAAKRSGSFRVEPLTDADLPQLKQAYEDGGPNGQLALLDHLAGFKNPAAVAGAARQITNDPEGGGFRVASQYYSQPGGRTVARDILQGHKELSLNPNLFNKVAAEAAFQPYLKSALQLAPPDMKADVFEAAKAIYAARSVKLNHAQWDGAYFNRSIEAALGLYHQSGFTYGGTGKKNGESVVVPQGWTADGLFQRIARATPEEWTAAAGGSKPAWPDGSDVTPAQLAQLTPVWLGQSNYALRTRAGRILQAKEGDHFVFDAAKIKWP